MGNMAGGVGPSGGAYSGAGGRVYGTLSVAERLLDPMIHLTSYRTGLPVEGDDSDDISEDGENSIPDDEDDEDSNGAFSDRSVQYFT